jgi:hypothetical protein
MAWPALKSGKIDELIAAALVAHHLITFARDATRQRASFYTTLPRPAPIKQAA